MSVKLGRYRRGGWEVDINLRLPNGRRHRERSKAPVPSKSAAQRWGEDRERHLLQHGLPESKREVPTLKEFTPRFLDGYARANRHKPSGVAQKETTIRVHLIPQLGAKRLDAITTADVQQLKHAMRGKAPKTVNNGLTVLNKIADVAVEWGVISSVPFKVRLLKIGEGSRR